MGKRENEKRDFRQKLIRIVAIAAVLISGFCVFESFKPELAEIPYTEFYEKVAKAQVEAIAVDLKDGAYLEATLKDGTKVKTDNPKTETFKVDMLNHGVKVTEKTTSIWARMLPSLLTPLIFMGAMMYALRMQMGGLKQSSPIADVPEVRFSDVAGLANIKADLSLIVEYLKDATRFEQIGAKLPAGALLYGNPGTGKTLIAKAVAGEAGVPFFALSGADFVELYAGNGAKRARKLFEAAREHAPCIVFIDELDAIGRKRSGADDSERRQTLNALLAEMDGFDSETGVFVLAATNRISDLDEALIRPGRFDKHIGVQGPRTVNERLAVLQLHADGKQFASDFKWDVIAKETTGFSPSDLATLLNEAALIAVQQGLEVITTTCAQQAHYQYIMKGHQIDKPDRTDTEARLVAYHEAGHAVIAKYLQMDVTRVTILPSTSGAGGANFIVPQKDGLHSRQDMMNQVMMTYGGRVVEELIYGVDHVTTGAVSDIEQATHILRQMALSYGMTADGAHLDYTQLGEQDAYIERIESLSKQCYAEARVIISSHREQIEAIVEALLSRGTVYADELTEIMEQKHLIESQSNN